MSRIHTIIINQPDIPEEFPDKDLYISEDGWYKPYDFWLSTCGIYDLYRYSLDLLGGDVSGKKILDCGSGKGQTAIMLAKRGANVTGFDLEVEELLLARQLTKANNVNIEFLERPFEELDFPDGHFDYLFGSFILHHVNVSEAAKHIDRLLKPGGKAVFIENSNRNPLLRLFRAMIVGRFGVPKYGDDEEEHPLNSQDIKNLQANFSGEVRMHFPSLLFFRLVDFYVLQRQPKFLSGLMEGLDSTFGALPILRPLSYFQILELQKP